MFYRFGLFCGITLISIGSFPSIALAQVLVNNLKSQVAVEAVSQDVSASSMINVAEIEVVGNTIFEAEIRRLAAAYKGKTVSFNQLQELKNQISRLYTEAGYINSGAYLPEQKISDGDVLVEVLEGELGEVNVSGTGRLNKNYIKSHFDSLSHPVSSSDLLDRLHTLRLDPLIKNISAELSAGTVPGKSVLDIEVTRADAFTLSSEYNNFKSPAIGTNARSIGLSHGNLLGFGDRFNANYINTSGSNSFDFAYNIPVNSRNGRLYAGYGFNNNDVVEEAFNALDIEGKSNFLVLGVKQPLLVKADREFSLGLEFSKQHSETTLLDSPFALSRGADAEGNTNISSLRFAQEYVQRGADEVLALRSQFSFGLGAFDATVNNDGRPDSKYVSWLGQGQWVRSLGDDFPLVLRSNIQLASDNLLPLEQFRVGGINTVRGYRRDSVLADNGVTASAEVRFPVWRPTEGSLIQLAPFLDFGTSWNKGDEIELEVSTLASVGMGLNFTTSNGFKARIDWGIPILATDVEDRPISFSLGFGI